ncbi:amidase [Pelagibius litoralis]|uniref:Amidase n=1 Tax=Pelagibius litoralis TaxID=374515 RepID=A0A967K8R5_9PROT|nr:amidase [Pelagibius litoralis]NIA70603.1 amidase [Pelagibius litoralis]
MIDAETLSRATAAGIGRLIAGGVTDPVEVAEYFLGRATEAKEQNVFLCVTAARAKREAEASLKRYRDGRALGPLDGVPLSWKDLFDVAGSPTTAGSALLRDTAAVQQDAPVVANAAAAGMICLGKVNLTEFAYSGLGLNPHYGTPANPHDQAVARAPGGSSSGSAVSVACGANPCSIGTDTGGSVRIPAAFNGLVGYKTSERRVDKSAVFPLSDTLDTVGPLTRSVEDAVLLDMALRGAVASAVRRADLSSLRLVVPESVAFDGIEDAVAANFERCIDRLSAVGASVERRRFTLFEEVEAVTAEHGSLTAAEAYFVHRGRVDGADCAKVDRRVVARILGGKRMSSHDLISVLRQRSRLIAAFGRELDGALLAMPTVAHTAPEIGPLEADDELFHEVNLKTLRNTMLGNFLATCGLALPSGCDAKGLPTSILFSAPGGCDEKLLSDGLAIESALSEV